MRVLTKHHKVADGKVMEMETKELAEFLIEQEGLTKAQANNVVKAARKRAGIYQKLTKKQAEDLNLIPRLNSPEHQKMLRDVVSHLGNFKKAGRSKRRTKRMNPARRKMVYGE